MVLFSVPRSLSLAEVERVGIWGGNGGGDGTVVTESDIFTNSLWGSLVVKQPLFLSRISFEGIGGIRKI